MSSREAGVFLIFFKDRSNSRFFGFHWLKGNRLRGYFSVFIGIYRKNGTLDISEHSSWIMRNFYLPKTAEP